MRGPRQPQGCVISSVFRSARGECELSVCRPAPCPNTHPHPWRAMRLAPSALPPWPGIAGQGAAGPILPEWDLPRDVAGLSVFVHAQCPPILLAASAHRMLCPPERAPIDWAPHLRLCFPPSDTCPTPRPPAARVSPWCHQRHWQIAPLVFLAAGHLSIGTVTLLPRLELSSTFTLTFARVHCLLTRPRVAFAPPHPVERHPCAAL